MAAPVDGRSAGAREAADAAGPVRTAGVAGALLRIGEAFTYAK